MLWHGLLMNAFHYVMKKRRWGNPQGSHNLVGGPENKYTFRIDNIKILPYLTIQDILTFKKKGKQKPCG